MLRKLIFHHLRMWNQSLVELELFCSTVSAASSSVSTLSCSHSVSTVSSRVDILQNLRFQLNTTSKIQFLFTDHQTQFHRVSSTSHIDLSTALHHYLQSWTEYPESVSFSRVCRHLHVCKDLLGMAWWSSTYSRCFWEINNELQSSSLLLLLHILEKQSSDEEKTKNC